jgi:hypothetical protein
MENLEAILKTNAQIDLEEHEKKKRIERQEALINKNKLKQTKLIDRQV